MTKIIHYHKFDASIQESQRWALIMCDFWEEYFFDPKILSVKCLMTVRPPSLSLIFLPVAVKSAVRMRRQGLIGAFFFTIWLLPLMWHAHWISKDRRSQSRKGNSKKRVGLWLAGDSSSAWRHRSLRLCSGLLSYIRVKWAPSPRAQQDVAEEDGWKREMGFWHSGDTDSPCTQRAQILMNEPDARFLILTAF